MSGFGLLASAALVRPGPILTPNNVPLLAELIITNHEDVEFIEQANAIDLKCSVCLNIVASPLNLNCPHILCKMCAENLPLAERNCPECREPLPNLLQLNAFLQQQVWNRPAKCKIAQNGCGWQEAVGTDYRAYRAHYKECLYKAFRCGACETFVLVRDIPDHANACEARIVECSDCTEKMQFRALQAHRANGPVLPPAGRAPCIRTQFCPNLCQTSEGQYTVLKDENKSRHIHYACPLRLSTCNMCHNEMTAQEMPAHETACDCRPARCGECQATLKFKEMDEHSKAEPIQHEGHTITPRCRGMEVCPNRCRSSDAPDAPFTQYVHPVVRTIAGSAINVTKAPDHAAHCPLRKVVCSMCQEYVTASSLEKHEKDRCLHRIVACRHCGDKMKFCDLPKHVTALMKSQAQSNSSTQETTGPSSVAVAAAGRDTTNECTAKRSKSTKKKKHNSLSSSVSGDMSVPCVSFVRCKLGCKDHGSVKLLRKSGEEEQYNKCGMRLVPCPCCTSKIAADSLHSHLLDQVKQNPQKFVHLVIAQSTQVKETCDQLDTARGKAKAEKQDHHAKRQQQYEQTKAKFDEQNQHLFQLALLTAKQNGYCISFLSNHKCDKADCKYVHKYVKNGEWYQRKTTSSSSSTRYSVSSHYRSEDNWKDSHFGYF